MVTPNELQDLLAESRDPAVRRAVWECSKTVGPPLRDRLLELQTLRNAVAREMGYSSYFALKCDDYGLTAAEMMTLMDDVVAGVMPLYAAAPHLDAVPAGRALRRRRGARAPARALDRQPLGPGVARPRRGRRPRRDDGRPHAAVGHRAGRALLREPRPAGACRRRSGRTATSTSCPPAPTRKKNTHASAWHVDLDQDVRSLMSVRSDYDWFTTTHHELGHIYYYLAYSRPEVPPILRRGANRAFHEAVGTLIELACGQVPYLEQVGLLAPGQAPEQSSWLLSQALTGPIVFLPFAAGTMAHWEHDFYEDQPARRPAQRALVAATPTASRASSRPPRAARSSATPPPRPTSSTTPPSTTTTRSAP